MAGADVDYRTEPDVRAAAIEFRQKHDALDWSADVDTLIKLHGYDQERYSANAPSGVGAILKPAITSTRKKVKALVSVTEQVILLSDELHDAQQPFAKAHELGHAVIEWHRDILYVCDEHDLSPRTRQQMEFEANTFASEVLLPEELLQPYYGAFDISMETVLLIKEKAGTSIEMTVYAYVKHHPEVCGVAVLEHIKDKEGTATAVKLTRKSLSKKAAKTHAAGISLIENGQLFERGHLVFKCAQILRRPTETEIHIGERKEKNRCKASIFNSGYKTFCLLSPADD